MSTVDNVSWTPTYEPSGVSGGAENLLNQDVFLNLLLEQLKNQDPLDPMSSEDMTSQLAQLASLEELRAVNDNFEDLFIYQMSLNNAQAVSLIGKEVKALGNWADITDEGAASFSFYLAADAKDVTITITDENGDAIRTIELYDLESGEQSTFWDGLDDDGEHVDAGRYEFSISAVNEDDETVKVDTFIEGVVEAIRYEGGIPYLIIGDDEFLLGDIFEINLPSEG